MLFTDVLKDLGIPYASVGESEHVTRNFIGLDCPWCADHGQFHLGYHLYLNYCKCWHCGWHSPIEVVATLANISFQEAKKLLGGLDATFGEIGAPRGILSLPKGIGPLLECHKDYLRSRKLNPEEMEKLWGLGGIGLTGALRWRVFVPIHYRGKTVSWTTRSIVASAKRYHSAGSDEEALPAKSLLYGEDYARHTVVVCEGPFDVMRLGPGAVGTFGKSVSRAQVARLAKFPVRYVCLDNEPDTQGKARQLCAELSAFPGKTYNLLLDAKDPGEAAEREIKQLRRLLE